MKLRETLIKSFKLVANHSRVILIAQIKRELVRDACWFAKKIKSSSWARDELSEAMKRHDDELNDMSEVDETIRLCLDCSSATLFLTRHLRWRATLRVFFFSMNKTRLLMIRQTANVELLKNETMQRDASILRFKQNNERTWEEKRNEWELLFLINRIARRASSATLELWRKTTIIEIAKIEMKSNCSRTSRQAIAKQNTNCCFSLEIAINLIYEHSKRQMTRQRIHHELRIWERVNLDFKESSRFSWAMINRINQSIVKASSVALNL